MVEVKTYKDLLIWQKSHLATKLIISLVRKLPNDRVSNILMNQLVRAACSVPANISEGFGRYHSREFSRFLTIAAGSANETDYWLVLLKDSYPNFSNEIDNIISANLESCKLLAVTIKKINGSS